MQNQRGFIGTGVLIAILVGLIVVGGGVYFVMQQRSSLQTTSATTAAPDSVSDRMEKGRYDSVLNNLPNADRATFEELGDNYYGTRNNLFRDKNNIYYFPTDSKKSGVVSGVDVKTFAHVKYIYYKDKNAAYYLDWDNEGSNPLRKIVNSNSDSFQALNYWYSKDGQRVYFLGTQNAGTIKLNVIDGALASSFSSTYFGDLRGAEGIDIGRFGTDSAHVFSWGRMVAGADVNTFVALDNTYYFKDANNVYTYGSSVQDDGTLPTKVLVGVSPQTFVVLGEGYGKTGDSVYFLDKKIAGADVATFKSRSGHGMNLGEDKNRLYEAGVVY